MISSGLSADLNSRVIPPLGHPSPRPSPAGPGQARRILTPTTGHETRLGQKAAKEGKPGSGSRWLGLPSAVEPTRNQKNHFGTLGQPHLCELPPFLLSSLPLKFPPSPSYTLLPAPFRIFSCPNGESWSPLPARPVVKSRGLSRGSPRLSPALPPISRRKRGFSILVVRYATLRNRMHRISRSWQVELFVIFQAFSQFFYFSKIFVGLLLVLMFLLIVRDNLQISICAGSKFNIFSNFRSVFKVLSPFHRRYEIFLDFRYYQCRGIFVTH